MENKQTKKTRGKRNAAKKQKNQTKRIIGIAAGILTLLCLIVTGTQIVQKKEQAAPTFDTLVSSQKQDALQMEVQRWKQKHQNQCAKLHDLRQKLLETTQKLYEVKGYLFTKNDPDNQARLAKACNALVNREIELKNALHSLRKLQDKHTSSEKLLKRHEKTIEALALMNETERLEKESIAKQFQEQCLAIQNQMDDQSEALNQKIDNLNREKDALTIALNQKSKSIQDLENLVELQFGELYARKNEIEENATLFSRSENHLQERIYDLMAILEIEKIEQNHLQSQLNVAKSEKKAFLHYKNATEDLVKKLKLENERQSDLFCQIVDLHGLIDIYADAHQKIKREKEDLVTALAATQNSLEENQIAMQTISAHYQLEKGRLDEFSSCLSTTLEEKKRAEDMIRHLKNRLKQAEDTTAFLQTRIVEKSEENKNFTKEIEAVNSALNTEKQKVIDMQRAMETAKTSQTDQNEVMLKHLKTRVASLEKSLNQATKQLKIAITQTKKRSNKYHIVGKEETLTTLSLQYFGTPKYWEAIYNANKDVIPDKRHLSPGTKLIIPAKNEDLEKGALTRYQG